MKEKIKNALEEILYTNLEIGRKNDNRCVTAANRILSDIKKNGNILSYGYNIDVDSSFS